MEPELTEDQEAMVVAAIQEEMEKLRMEFIYAALLLNNDPIPARLN